MNEPSPPRTSDRASRFLLDFTLGLLRAGETEEARLLAIEIIRKSEIATKLTIEDAATLIEAIMAITDDDEWRAAMRDVIDLELAGRLN